MNISDIRGKKVQLERDIAILLEDFEKECRVSITRVEILTTQEKNMFLDSRHNVKVEVVL